MMMARARTHQPGEEKKMETDPSLAAKEEETRRLESIVLECGKAAKLLLEGSHQHEVQPALVPSRVGLD